MKYPALYLSAVALTAFLPSTRATDYTYSSTTTNTAWNNAAAWGGGGSPSSIADNVVGNSAFGTLQVNANYTIGNFTATGASPWVINSSVASPGVTLNMQTLANTGAGLLTFRTNGGNTLGLTVNQVNVTNGNIQFGAPGAAAGTLAALSVGTGVSLSGGNLLLRTATASYNLKAVNFSGSTTAGISLINNSSAGTGDVRTATVTSLNSSGTGAYTIRGSAVTWTGFTHAATLDINNTGTDSATVTLTNGTGGTLALVKNGAGTQTLNLGTSDYTGATTVNAGTLNLNGSLTASATTVNSGATLGGSGTIQGLTINTGGIVTGSLNAGTTTVAGTLGGSGTVGALTINSGGVVTGSVNGGTTIVNSGGTLGGSGTFGAVTLASGATIAPGNSPGTLNVGATTLAGNTTYAWEINDVAGTAGSDPGWDLINSSSTVDITANSGSLFTIDVASLTALNAGGDAVGFVDSNSYSWTIIASTGGISFSNGGSTADSFLIDLTDFTNVYTGTFSVALTNGGNDLSLIYTAIPEPSTYAALAGVMVLGVAIYRRRRNQA